MGPKELRARTTVRTWTTVELVIFSMVMTVMTLTRGQRGSPASALATALATSSTGRVQRLQELPASQLSRRFSTLKPTYLYLNAPMGACLLMNRVCSNAKVTWCLTSSRGASLAAPMLIFVIRSLLQSTKLDQRQRLQRWIPPFIMLLSSSP